jgi:ABC-type polysaccharide/polyol phosphate transport system ATPase subunit
MSDIVIKAKRLSKNYVIGHERGKEPSSFREMLANSANRLTAAARAVVKGQPLVRGDTNEVFWALRDVDFEIKRGEVVGVLGRNGAGKSTLLKVLSRVTEPTSGRVEIRGRLASLLEVGTGFHPELTGRENIYLNGAVLGMTRSEIRRRFDQIVDFAGVETFLDTPVKRYSSGMYVRLAFAVAAHLEPDIFIVDEVLAVGDAEFQKKCLGKMKDISGGGRTVLFVSHNTSSLLSLCDRGLLLANGKIIKDASIADAVDTYSSAFFSTKEKRSVLNTEGDFEIVCVTLTGPDCKEKSEFLIGEPIKIIIKYRAHRKILSPYFWFRIFTKSNLICEADSKSDSISFRDLHGDGTMCVTLKGINLAPGHIYTIRMGARRVESHKFLIETSDVASFRITQNEATGAQEGTKSIQDWASSAPVLTENAWEISYGSSNNSALDRPYKN